MSKQDEQRLAKLVKKLGGKPASSPRTDRSAQYDSTLRQRAPEQDSETKRLFKEMKKREF
jgi:hypothetical protein